MPIIAARRYADIAIGLQIGARQELVFIDGRQWVVLGDNNLPHPLLGPPHVPGPDRMVTASALTFINGIPVCRKGDLAGCAHPTTGSGPTYSD